MLISELLYKFLLFLIILKIIILIFNNYFINKNFELKSYLLVMKNLKEKYSGVYINEVLLNTLKNYNIEYNIIR